MTITHVLLNNGQLGKITKEQRAGDWDVWQTELHNPDFAACAELCGALGFRVDVRRPTRRGARRGFAVDGPVARRGHDGRGPRVIGEVFPDLVLCDHAGNERSLSDLVVGDPTVVQTYRGWWCPKEQAFFRALVALQDEMEVAYTRIVSISIDPPPVTAAFRAGLGARWTFLCDPDRVAQERARPTRDDRHGLSTLRAGRLHALPGPDGAPRVRRLLVLGAPDPRGAAPGHARDHAGRPPRLARPDAMTWHWLALVGERPADATAAAAAHEPDGTPAGFLAIWRSRAKPRRDARRVDARLLDADGAEALVSLVRPPPGVRLLFDDLAVQHARRAVLAALPLDGVTTLLSDASHFEGSLTVARGDGVARLADDPFARIFPARLLHVGAGVVGRLPAPAGPVIERYGSAQPWPQDRFGSAR